MFDSDFGLLNAGGCYLL